MMDEPEIVGDWERERVLGCGGFGVVTLWKNCKNYERIAIKKYRGDNDNLTEKQKNRWIQEVDMMKTIECDNIVNFKILPPGLEQELNKHNPSRLPMLSMEYCSLGDLRSILLRSENCCGLFESDIRYILKDLMNAVSYLHTLKITHRDLKPENIVLQTSDRPNGIIYKLIDLGYAKEIDTKSVCASLVGTMQYLAPELLYSKTYSCSVDYWSMGLVAFEIICGVRPFLPNKSPVQWMFHVHKKSSDVISIHQLSEAEDSIKSFKEIFQETHISSCFKSYIEFWFQLALEYNPRKRGYRNYDPDNTENELEIFSSLRELLEKKFITVFCVYNCKFLSYEIDDCTMIETVKGWIERDTKIVKSEQVLLSPRCDNIELDGLALQAFDQTYTQPVLYVYKKSEMLVTDLKPNYIPESVGEMLKNSTKNLQYYFLRRTCAHALYFIYTEVNNYNTILGACSLRIKNILKTCDQITQKCRTMNINIEKLSAQKDLSKELLDFDCEQYLKNYSQNPNHWSESFNNISKKIEKLHEACNHIASRHESIYRRTNALSISFNKEFSKHNDHNLNKLMDDALECYNNVKCRSRDQRNKPENCKNMTKIVYDVLKNRDLVLHDKNFWTYLQIIVDLDLQIEKMLSPLTSALEHIEKYKTELMNDNLTRQTKIWEFTIKPKSKPKVESELKPNFIIGNPTSIENYGSPISLDKPLHFILGDTSKYSSSLESSHSFKTANNSLEKQQNRLENNAKQMEETNAKQLRETDAKQLQVTNAKQLLERNAKQHHEAIKQNGYETKEDKNKEPKTIQVTLPNFAIGEPISDMIQYNLSLRHELEEKTHESFINYKSILSDQLDFSFLTEQ